MPKLIFSGDTLAAAVLDSPEEIAAVIYAIRHVLNIGAHADQDYHLRRLLRDLTAPAPKGTP